MAMTIKSQSHTVSIPVLGAPCASASSSFDAASTRHLVVITNEEYLDRIVNKLSTFGQVDDIKAWATDDPPHDQVYALITFRYVADLQRVLRPVQNAKSGVIMTINFPANTQALPIYGGHALSAPQSTQGIPTASVREIGIIQHHPHPEPALQAEPAGTTRSVVFFDVRGNAVGLTLNFQLAIEATWRRVHENILADLEQDYLGRSPIAKAVPQPWRGKWWIIYPDFDMKRNRTTFESVDVARRVIRKMQGKWGVNWQVAEGRYVSDPIAMEELGNGDIIHTPSEPELMLERR